MPSSRPGDRIVSTANTDERFGRLAPTRPSGKFGSRRTVYAGQTYDSLAEATYAQLLDWRTAAGEIARWERGRSWVLLDAEKARDRIRFTPDFELWLTDADKEQPDQVIDVKGGKATQTEAFRLRAKLWKARYPGIPLVVVDGTG